MRAADAAIGINKFMKHDELESRLYRVLDTMRSGFAKTLDYWGEDDGGGVYLRTYGDEVAYADDGPDAFAVEAALAEVEGMFQGERLRARLQVRRDYHCLEDIVDVRWDIENPKIMARWLRSMEPRLDEFRSPPDLPDWEWEAARHCWPTHHPVDLLFAAGPRTTPQTAEFGRWVDREICPDVVRLLGGWHEHDDGDVLCFFRLTNVCTQSQWIIGSASGTLHSTVLVDTVAVVVVNWLVTIGLRLSGISIHTYVDDEGVGQEPLTPELRDQLKDAGLLLRGCLAERWGERTLTLLCRLKWASPEIVFSEGAVGDFGNQKPRNPCQGQPPIGFYWSEAIRRR